MRLGYEWFLHVQQKDPTKIPVLFSSIGFKKGFGDWFVNTLLPEWVETPKHYQTEEATKIGKDVGFKAQDKYFANDMMSADPQMRRNLFLK